MKSGESLRKIRDKFKDEVTEKIEKFKEETGLYITGIYISAHKTMRLGEGKIDSIVITKVEVEEI